MLVCGAMLFAGAMQVAFAFRRFQRILCCLVLGMPISTARLYLYTLGILIECCFDGITHSEATNFTRKRWVSRQHFFLNAALTSSRTRRSCTSMDSLGE
jgi:hypothetical protein